MAAKAVKGKPGEVSFTLSVAEHGREPILLAAFLLTDRAWAELSSAKAGKLKVTLRLKAGGDLKALGEEFLAELETQKLRWTLLKDNAAVREYVARQAVLLAHGHQVPPAAAAPAAAQPEALTPDQQAEIDRLIAEVEVEIKDLKAKKLDPDNVAATWEEKHTEKDK